MFKIDLQDEEEGKSYTISAIEEEYQEIIGGNLILATQLLKKQQEKENFMAAFNITQQSTTCVSTPQASPSLETEPGTSQWTEKENSGNMKLWNHEAILMLINLCGKYDKDFENGVKKYVWAKISKEMSEYFNQEFSVQQCDTKWKGLKNTYKLVKKHNDQSGNTRKTWKYFNEIDQILYSRPEIQSPATCSSRTGLVVRQNAVPERGNEDENDPVIDSEHWNRSANTPSSSYQSSFMQKRKASENVVERRHREKMARQDRYLDLLERLTKAVEVNSTPREAE